jgi:hypothetical protein
MSNDIYISTLRILNNTIELDRPCWNCSTCDPFDNYKQVYYKPTWNQDDFCPECEGKQVIPTDNGLELLGFISKYRKLEAL